MSPIDSKNVSVFCENLSWVPACSIAGGKPRENRNVAAHLPYSYTHSIYHSLSGTLVWPMATIYIPNISWKALEGCLANIYFFLLFLVVEPLQVLVGVRGWGVGLWSALAEWRHETLDFKSSSLQFHRYLFMWISIRNCFCWCFVCFFFFFYFWWRVSVKWLISGKGNQDLAVERHSIVLTQNNK